jgi:chromosome segregation ATPase
VSNLKQESESLLTRIAKLESDLEGSEAARSGLEARTADLAERLVESEAECGTLRAEKEEMRIQMTAIQAEIKEVTVLLLRV